MIASLPPTVESMLRSLRRRVWRDGLRSHLRIGAWMAGAVLFAGGIAHIALAQQDRGIVIAAALAALTVSGVIGIARRLPTMSFAAAEADRRYRASDLFASAWEAAAAPPERRTGAAELVLARAEAHAARFVRLPESREPMRRDPRRWLPLAPMVAGGLLLMLPGAGTASRADGDAAEAANPSSIGPSLEAVVDALARAARADRADAGARPAPVPVSQLPSLQAGNVPIAPAFDVRTPDVPSIARDVPGPGGTPSAGGIDPGDAPASTLKSRSSEREDAPGASRRVALDRRPGGMGEGGVPLAPVGALPNPPSEATPTRAGDAAPLPASWPPALRRYVAAVLARPEPTR